MKIIISLVLMFGSLMAFATDVKPNCFFVAGDPVTAFSVETIYHEAINGQATSRTYEGSKVVLLDNKKYSVNLIIHAARANKDGFRGAQVRLEQIDDQGRVTLSASSYTMFGMEEVGLQLPFKFGLTFKSDAGKQYQVDCGVAK